MTLKEKLSDWVGWEGAEFELAVLLGLVEAGEESWLKNKGIFWTANPVSDALSQMLQALVKAGVLEYRTEPDHEFRWNKDHSLSAL
jgi:hypothetical protein